jgi:hypothetical protein
MTEAEWLASTDPIAMLDWAMQSHFRPSDRKLRLAMCAMTRAAGADNTELLRRVSLAERWADGEIDREAVVADEPGASTSWRDWVIAHHIPRDAIEWASQSYRWVAPFVLREVCGNPFQTVTCRTKEPCKACEFRKGVRLGFRDKAWAAARDSCPCGGKQVIEVSPPWLTPLVLQLAEAAYTVRTGTGTLDNDALAVLSDALEDAGLPECVPFLTCNGTGKHRHSGRAGEVIHGVLHNCDPRKAHHHHDEKCQILSKPNPILAHLREPGPHYRGCWVLDLLLGKE